LDLGLSLVAVGQSLVINPDWVAHAQVGRDSDIRLAISAGDVAPTRIPHKLWAVIEATPGWFSVIASSSGQIGT
jgi:2,4-dienoyl-CoA reductase-like NADH-dependent reductase (Old Yellow Enzyme family)